jgi:hypothetical protein
MFTQIFNVGDRVTHNKYPKNQVGIVTDVSNSCTKFYRVKFSYEIHPCLAEHLAHYKGDDKIMTHRTQEKVVVTVAQYEALKHLELNTIPLTGKAEIIKVHALQSNSWSYDKSALNDLELDTLIRALYIGYEVPPSKEEMEIQAIKSLYYDSDVKTRRTILHMLNILDRKIEGVNV